MKLVGGDSGRYERRQFVDEVLIAPSERAIVDVLFDRPGLVTLEHHHPGRRYPLAAITVREEWAVPSRAPQFGFERDDADLAAVRRSIAPHFAAAPQKTIAFVAEMEMPGVEGSVVYACPMHPDIVSDNPGRCPRCGMRLQPSLPAVATDDHNQTSDQHHGVEHGPADGIEWEDDMPKFNRTTTPANMRWKLVDRATGAENQAIDWQFRVGDLVKIRLINEMDSDHPMHHPFHIHGAGRFLVLSRDDEPIRNLVWKDTVLSGPARWSTSCSMSPTPAYGWPTATSRRHHEGGMMFSFTVCP